MSNVLIGVIGVILFIGLALAGALFLGGRFSQSQTESEAARLVTEGSQISSAYDLYSVNEGRYPDGAGSGAATPSDAKLDELVAKGYLKDKPAGGKPTSGYQNTWYIDETKGAALTLIGDDSRSADVCKAARRQVGFTDDVKACNASDIQDNDPCCLAA